MKIKVLFTSGILTVLGLTGCNLGPKACIPKVEFIDEWLSADAEILPVAEPLSLGNLFDDPLLSGYLRDLLSANHDLKIARVKVQEAFALRCLSSAKLLPYIDGRVDDHRAFPAGGSLRSGRSAASPAAGIPLNLKQQNFLSDFDALWELDFFGRNRKEVESAEAFICMQKASYLASLLSLQGECARIYLELRRSQNNLALIQKELAVLKEKERTISVRAHHGLDSEIPLIETKAIIAEIHASERLFEGEVLRYMYNLSFLLGKPPSYLMEELKLNPAIPKLRDSVPIGFPADLLRRRPDIILAEGRIAKARRGRMVAS